MDSLIPALITTSPAELVSEFPVAMEMAPDDMIDEPLDTLTGPLFACVDSTVPIETDDAPVREAEPPVIIAPKPDDSVSEPPEVSPDPAFTTILPPGSFRLAPADIDMEPASSVRESPVLNNNDPLPPETEEPENNLTGPDIADDEIDEIATPSVPPCNVA